MHRHFAFLPPSHSLFHYVLLVCCLATEHMFTIVGVATYVCVNDVHTHVKCGCDIKSGKRCLYYYCECCTLLLMYSYYNYVSIFLFYFLLIVAIVCNGIMHDYSLLQLTLGAPVHEGYCGLFVCVCMSVCYHSSANVRCVCDKLNLLSKSFLFFRMQISIKHLISLYSYIFFFSLARPRRPFSIIEVATWQVQLTTITYER